MSGTVAGFTARPQSLSRAEIALHCYLTKPVCRRLSGPLVGLPAICPARDAYD
jgi:hypothetical protein